MNHKKVILLFLFFAALLLAALSMPVLRESKGELVYLFDDTYINMAMARNIVQHGVFGVTRYEFTHSSSTPLWTLLMALFYGLLGARLWLPLVLNIIAGFTLVIFAGNIFSRKYPPLSGAWLFTALAALFFLPALPALILGGMEHTAQTLLVILFCYFLCEYLSGPPGKLPRRLLLLAPCITTIRYEGIFLIFLAFLFSLRKKDWKAAFLLAGLGALPVFLIGLWGLSQGSTFLPNSLLLKAAAPDLSTVTGIQMFLKAGYLKITGSPEILFLLVLAFLLTIPGLYNRGASDSEQQGLLLFIFLTLLHVHFASTALFYRYEAYLIALGIFMIINVLLTLKARREFPAWPIRVFFILVFFLPFYALLERGAQALAKTPQAMMNVYEQQVQMGKFLKEHYSGEVVAANDIGAINYYADIRCLDLVGLGNNRVAAMIHAGTYNPQTLKALIEEKQARIAVIYDFWLNHPSFGGVPREWTRVGMWRIKNNVICANDTVHFFALRPEEAAPLREHLRAFTSRLPGSVLQVLDTQADLNTRTV